MSLGDIRGNRFERNSVGREARSFNAAEIEILTGPLPTVSRHATAARHSPAAPPHSTPGHRCGPTSAGHHVVGGESVGERHSAGEGGALTTAVGSSLPGRAPPDFYSVGFPPLAAT